MHPDRSQPPWLLPGLALALFAACNAEAHSRAGEPHPLGLDPAPSQSPWDYLRTKYDTDGDGVVTALEYDRVGAEFATQDHNGDGVITAADFDTENLFVRFQQATRAQYMLLEYMQDDDEPMQLTGAEWLRAARVYDVNGDEVLEKGEFKAQHRSRRRKLIAPGWRENPPEAELQVPWYELLLGVDANGDGKLAFSEIDAFFSANDNGRGLWNAERYIELPMPPGFVSLSGPRVGTVAPDFTLELMDGGERVTLSSFAGKSPVALIFGSYT